MASIKFAIRRALSSVSIGFRGKYTNVRFFFVDLPLSPQTFSRYFAEEYSEEKSFKKVVTIDCLNSVFGHNWNCFQFAQSETRKRVIGNVQLHFRQKCIAQTNRQTLTRYQYLSYL